MLTRTRRAAVVQVPIDDRAHRSDERLVRRTAQQIAQPVAGASVHCDHRDARLDPHLDGRHLMAPVVGHNHVRTVQMCEWQHAALLEHDTCNAKNCAGCRDLRQGDDADLRELMQLMAAQ